jgi:equilibrative nucleoside transporter 1/2/3
MCRIVQIGRLVVNHRWIITKENIWIFAVLRVCCLPLIVCSIKGWVFTNDFWSISFVSFLGFTNGYLGSLAIIMVSEWVNFKNKGLAGTFVSVIELLLCM